MTSIEKIENFLDSGYAGRLSERDHVVKLTKAIRLAVSALIVIQSKAGSRIARMVLSDISEILQ